MRIHDGAFPAMDLTARHPRTGELLSTVKFMVQTLAAAGELQRDLQRELTYDRLRAAEAKGAKGGRRPAVAAAQTADVRTAYPEGRSIAALARDHGVSRGAIRNAVADPLPDHTASEEGAPALELSSRRRGTGVRAVDAVREHRPDVALLDIRMPTLDGIHRELPGTAVVMLTTFGEDDFIARALSGGADGFLLKADDPRELPAGVHAVAGGGAYLSPKVAACVVAGLRAGGSGAAAVRPLAERLTGREHDVLALVGGGLSNAEIGGRLHLVEGTVKAHVSAILAKLGVRNRVQAAIAAYEAGLVGRDRDDRP